jgi:hypothetical protein
MPGGELGLSHPARSGEPGLLLGARIGAYAVEDYKGIPVKAKGVNLQLHYDARRNRFRTGASVQNWIYFVGAEVGLVAEFDDGALEPGLQVALQPTLVGMGSVVFRLVHFPDSLLPWRSEIAFQVQWPHGFWADRLDDHRDSR